MSIDRHILEGIEACRPGSDDVQSADLADVARAVECDPEIHTIYARAQRWDTAVTRAVHEVPLPAGLADRLLARLATGVAATSAVAASVAVPAVEADAVSLPGQAVSLPGQAVSLPWQAIETQAIETQPFLSRRNWLSIAGATAATVVVAVGLARYLRSGADTPVEMLADGWLAQLDANWRDMAEAPKQLAVPLSITAEASGWQRIDAVRGASPVAYRLTHAQAGTAQLFVVRLSRQGLPTSPPEQPQMATGGRSIGYWTSGDLVYVLVVDGNRDSYRSFVNVSRMPLA
jgi:hypothetical protein